MRVCVFKENWTGRNRICMAIVINSNKYIFEIDEKEFNLVQKKLKKCKPTAHFLLVGNINTLPEEILELILIKLQKSIFV